MGRACPCHSVLASRGAGFCFGHAPSWAPAFHGTQWPPLSSHYPAHLPGEFFWPPAHLGLLWEFPGTHPPACLHPGIRGNVLWWCGTCQRGRGSMCTRKGASGLLPSSHTSSACRRLPLLGTSFHVGAPQCQEDTFFTREGPICVNYEGTTNPSTLGSKTQATTLPRRSFNVSHFFFPHVKTTSPSMHIGPRFWLPKAT